MGLEPPARVRRAFEEMGPSFVKLGQLLATRVELRVRPAEASGGLLRRADLDHQRA